MLTGLQQMWSRQLLSLTSYEEKYSQRLKFPAMVFEDAWEKKSVYFSADDLNGSHEGVCFFFTGAAC